MDARCSLATIFTTSSNPRSNTTTDGCLVSDAIAIIAFSNSICSLLHVSIYVKYICKIYLIKADSNEMSASPPSYPGYTHPALSNKVGTLKNLFVASPRGDLFGEFFSGISEHVREGLEKKTRERGGRGRMCLGLPGVSVSVSERMCVCGAQVCAWGGRRVVVPMVEGLSESFTPLSYRRCARGM